MHIKPRIRTQTYADIELRWDEDRYVAWASELADAAETAAAENNDYPIKYPECLVGHGGCLLCGYGSLLEELEHIAFQVSYDVGVEIETNNYWGLDITLVDPAPQEVDEYTKRLGEALDKFAPWVRAE